MGVAENMPDIYLAEHSVRTMFRLDYSWRAGRQNVRTRCLKWARILFNGMKLALRYEWNVKRFKIPSSLYTHLEHHKRIRSF